jgi:hypothetical protein
MTSTLPKGILGSVASRSTTLYQGNPDRNHQLWNIVSWFLVGFVLLDL